MDQTKKLFSAQLLNVENLLSLIFLPCLGSKLVSLEVFLRDAWKNRDVRFRDFPLLALQLSPNL
jgi:hypothetical protein